MNSDREKHTLPPEDYVYTSLTSETEHISAALGQNFFDLPIGPTNSMDPKLEIDIKEIIGEIPPPDPK